MDITQLALRFRQYASLECNGSSPLYEFLSLKISEDKEILELSAFAKDGQPVPNLLFGAIHHLLLTGSNHSLREYYPSIVEKPKKLEGSFSEFKDFCQENKEDIIKLLDSKIVQTNEVRRCSYLYPSFCYIYNKVKKPLALIEIGTSAGLQLFWDQYSYSYGDEQVYGDKNSNVHLVSEIKGEGQPFITNPPPISSRIGLDLHINHIDKTEDYLWLKSLIWPEHKERLELFEKAANHLKDKKVTLVEGDGVALLPEVAKRIPENAVICIFHTHVANQIPKEMKYQLLNTIKEIGKNRDITHLYNNLWDGKLHLDSFINGIEEEAIVGETEGHGRWFTWELA